MHTHMHAWAWKSGLISHLKISKGKILTEVYSDEGAKGFKNNTLRIQNPLSQSQVSVLLGRQKRLAAPRIHVGGS